MPMYKITQFSWSKESKVLSAYASDIHLTKREIYEGISVVNEKTKGFRKFKFTHTDTDGEDVFGWNFVSPDGIKLLIIND